MTDYDIHSNKMKFYYISKALRHCINLAPPNVYHASDKLDWLGCYKATVKYIKASIKYEADNADTVMGWHQQFKK